ncbi:MAG: hypothetical protein JM58_17910 [Peptococcaceae bacterium BICA1-8]|nr:MAG: hypothetical protein JM58_17910 [Peptococcaceae bacterium BICA1-8]
MNFKTELDIYKFIMNIETYILESRSVPFTNKVMVDKDEICDYLDRLRSRLPKEIEECQRIIEKKQFEEENEQNNNDSSVDIKPISEQKIVDLDDFQILNATKLYQDKQKECEELLKLAEQQAQEIIAGAYEYADKIVAKYQSQLERQILEVNEGRSQIANIKLKLKKA